MLCRRDMETIFDPVIKDVLRLVKLQVIEALCTQARTIGVCGSDFLQLNTGSL